MHYYVQFADPDREPTIFEWAGGLPALTQNYPPFLRKYAPADPLLAPVFVDMSTDHPAGREVTGRGVQRAQVLQRGV